MKNFNWEKFKKGEIVIHCDTEEKAKDFLKECNYKNARYNKGVYYKGNDSLPDYKSWNNYEKDTCYQYDLPYKMSCRHLDCYKNKNNYKIIEWKIDENFSINDIKPFYLVELMNDELYLVCEIQEGIILKNDDRFLFLRSYNNQFENNKYYNIKKVYGLSNSQYYCTTTNIEHRFLLWERKEEIKEMKPRRN